MIFEQEYTPHYDRSYARALYRAAVAARVGGEVSGICAVATFDGTAVPVATARAMAAQAAHRGRDGTCSWTSEGVALVQQVLAVTDYDRSDTVPASLGSLVCVADARIDNRQEVIYPLLRLGAIVDPDTATDAEIIVAAYRWWGDHCSARLVGDYAFVIWDTDRRRLFAARDPLGMRALYHRVEPGRRALVATEITQLLAAPGVPCEIDELGIAATLAGPYLPADRTAYAGIDQLAPGHTLTVDQGGVRVGRGWQPDPGMVADPGSDAATAALFRDVLSQAVADRLRACRPVGIFLSGGVDSGSVASTAGWLTERGAAAPPSVHAYSWAFQELDDSDERAVSDIIVERYGIPSSAVPGDDCWPLAAYPAHGPDRDDPFSSVYQALVERTLECCQRDGMGITLSGDRGDELTGDSVFDEVGLLRARRTKDALADIRHVVAESGMSAHMAVRRQLVRPLLEARYPRVAAGFRRRRGNHLWPPWVRDDLARRVDLGDLIAQQQTPPSFGGAARRLRAQRIFMAQGARIAVLQERTRARYGMAFADPYSDRRLVELILSLPQWRVQRRGSSKQLARAAMEGIMPEAARAATRKTIPIGLFDRGFRERSVGVVSQLMTGSLAAANGWLDEREVLDVHGQYRATGDTPYDFWWPMCVEMWLRRWWT